MLPKKRNNGSTILQMIKNTQEVNRINEALMQDDCLIGTKRKEESLPHESIIHSQNDSHKRLRNVMEILECLSNLYRFLFTC